MKTFQSMKVRMLLIPLCIYVNAFSQETSLSQLDSLYALALNQMQSDKYYESLKTIYTLQDISIAANIEAYKARSENLLGLAFIQHYAYNKAEEHFLAAIALNEKRNDTLHLGINFANLIHLYALNQDTDGYNKYFPLAKLYNTYTKGDQQFYIYESELIRLYDQKKYDSIIDFTAVIIDEINSDDYKVAFSKSSYKELLKKRLLITYQLYQSYALMEEGVQTEYANNLLDRLKKEHLQSVLWFSPRIYEHYYKISYYKTIYHKEYATLNLDSITHYQKNSRKYFNKTIDLLEYKSMLNNDYVIKTITREKELEKLKLINKTQEKENSFNKRINYLLLGITAFALLFLGYFIWMKRKVNQINTFLDIKNKELRLNTVNQNKFLSIVSHEIRTPLYTLKELISSFFKQENQVQKLNFEDQIKSAFLNLSHHIDNSLQYSRLNFFKINITLNNRTVHLTMFINNLADYFKPFANLNNCTLVIDNQSDTNLVLMDLDKIELVLKNLLKNAIEEPNSSVVTLRIQEEKIDAETARLIFSIIDNGNGITKDTLNSLKEENATYDPDKTHNGLKLGILLSNQLLSFYNTELTFSNIEDQEVTFSLEVTVVKQENPKLSTNTTSKKILYVDDNKINLLVTKKIIESFKIQCDVIDNGHDAIKQIQKEQYDLILMDLNMPTLNGFDTSIKIHAYNPNLPIIAYTALSKDEVLSQCITANMQDVITKSTEKSDLKNILLSYF